MWSKERHQRILAMLETNRQVSANDLAEMLGVSRETVRRDLVDLERDGRVSRVHGGAVLPQPRGEEPFQQRMGEQIRAKRDIARKAASLIRPGHSILVDAGTTTSIFAQELVKLSGFMVITNSIDIATTIQGAGADIDLLLLGGRVASDVPATLGELTLAEIRRFNVDMAFIAPVALQAGKGAFSFDLHEAEIATAMAEQARETVILVDHTKLGETSRVLSCAASRIDILVSDKNASPGALQPFRDAGVRVIA
ncbi:DeoR/GlpR family DNA-binding transcription regulator [Thalassovita aquimarina]|uniref:DeoR/GlpR transcriptional regulator n=1 Tax=Thalassovita aquimarina TaxID=2785917 RepID=A0ABS5HRE9_9RHOB|nr:DeoR/GlpR family DNA-binding transcription regulator [Thalassovita aquimarina]MBR9651541.1 DeoR/GlpR transcriptional regulator [Thalassovita aquimarina]